jgi:hypothetical protein
MLRFQTTYFRIILHASHTHTGVSVYEGRLKSSWTRLITPSWNFVEGRWRSLFRNTSTSKRCTSYNAPLTSRKRAADRWSLRNFLSRSSLFVERDLDCMADVLMGFHWSTFSKPNTEFNCGGAVTVSFSKYLPCQAKHFLQRPTHFSKTCCRQFAASFRRIVEQAVLTFHVPFSVSKAHPPLENRSSSP